MTTIDLTLFRIFKAKILLPSKWDELTERDLRFLGRHFPYASTIKFHVQLFIHFCNFPKRPLFSIYFSIFKAIHTDMLYIILSNGCKEKKSEWVFGWLFEEFTGENIPIKSFSHKRIKYLSPESGLHNITMEEFAEAEQFLDMMIKGQNYDALENLIAVLYKPAGVLFDEYKCYARAKEIEGIAPDLKRAIYLQYRANRKFMIDCNKNVFRKKGVKKANAASVTWKEIITDLSGDVVSMEDTKKMKAWTVFEFIKNQNKKAEREQLHSALKPR